MFDCFQDQQRVSVQLTLACDKPGVCEVGPGTCGADGTCAYAVRTQFPAPHFMLIGAAQVAS
jgi:hypothetical protein